MFFLKKAAVIYVAKTGTLAFVSSASWVAKIIVIKSCLLWFRYFLLLCDHLFHSFCSQHSTRGTNSQQVALSLQKSRGGITTCFQESAGFLSDLCNC